MQKKIIEEPIYERVQTGVNKKEVYITSDGKEFDNEKSAEYHEYYYCKLNRRGTKFDGSATIVNLYSIEDLERYEKDNTYSVDKFDYDKSILSFPNTYVFVEDDVYDNDSTDIDEYANSHELHLKIYTLDEYKNYIIDLLNDLESI